MVSQPAPPFAPGWDLESSPFHEGELAIQERLGVRNKIDLQGRRANRRYLTQQQREFFPMLPYVFLGSVDAAGQPWASILMGRPGFVASPDDNTLDVRARPLFGDPLHETLREGAALALLGAQLHTRRRNRAIGTAAKVGAEGFQLLVRQTLGLCPQYIQGREPEFHADPMIPAERPVYRMAALDDAARAIIAKADTYFVASVNPHAEHGILSGADISHRGGRPGFVRVDDPQTLTAPEFIGNFIFNTLGNWQLDNRAGLLFLDFDSGDLLYIAARAEVIWDSPERKAFAGAQRLVRYRIDQIIRVEASLPARFSVPDHSPLLAHTGQWEDVAATLEAERLHADWRPFRVARIVDESAVVRSFTFEPADGSGLAGYQPGQHLPIRVQPSGWAEPATRTYTLSDAPNGRCYRISVKREGSGGVSDWLHDTLQVGDTIETLSPRGSFTFDEAAERPVVLLSAGVGITPMIAMLNSQLVNTGRTRLHKPIYFVHAAIDGSRQAFAEHLRAKDALHSDLTLHIVYSSPGPDDRLGETHHSTGRIDRALLQKLLPLDDYEVYMCGPPGFMQANYDALLSLGVRDARIHFESFGPASVARRREPGVEAEAGEGVTVEFARSGKTAVWRPKAGSLLELAEAQGIVAAHSCRVGACGTCTTRVIAGSVDYAETPVHAIAEGEALICVGRPHAGLQRDDGTNRDGIVLDL